MEQTIVTTGWDYIYYFIIIIAIGFIYTSWNLDKIFRDLKNNVQYTKVLINTRSVWVINSIMMGAFAFLGMIILIEDTMTVNTLKGINLGYLGTFVFLSTILLYTIWHFALSVGAE